MNERKDHSSSETTHGLEELALTIAESLVDCGEVLSNITRHLFHIIFFEECYFLLEQAAKVQASQFNCELLGRLLHESIVQVRNDPDDGGHRQYCFQQGKHQSVQISRVFWIKCSDDLAKDHGEGWQQ